MKQVIPSVIIIFPGFSGCTSRNYCQQFYFSEGKEKWTELCPHHRGPGLQEKFGKCYISADFIPFNRQYHLSMRTRQENLGGKKRKLKARKLGVSSYFFDRSIESTKQTIILKYYTTQICQIQSGMNYVFVVFTNEKSPSLTPKIWNILRLDQA